MAERRADQSKPKPIVLVGFMASGKSEIGRSLAERLGIPFVDTDEAIENSFGLSIAEIFHQHGELAFREAERAFVRSLLAGDSKVIAVGGGAYLDPGSAELLNREARTIWLDTPIELILARLAGCDARPLASMRTEEELRQLWQKRRDAYALAQIRIEPVDDDPALVAERLAAILT